ncbi:MAG: hypothetical protein WCK51_12820 [Armatimonadota bacterium]
MRAKLRLLGGDLLVGPQGVSLSPKYHESFRLIRYVAAQGRSGVTSSFLAEALYSDTWDDPQTGLRTQLGRANRRAQEVGLEKLLERSGESIQFVSGVVTCDLWDLHDSCKGFSNSLESIECEQSAFALLEEIEPERLSEVLRTEPDSDSTRVIAETLLFCMERIVILPTLGGHRVRIVQILGVISSYLPFTSLNIESILKLYAACHCRQEVLQTYLDYETQIDNELGELPAARIKELCESLLRNLDYGAESQLVMLPRCPDVSFGLEHLLDETVRTIQGGGKIYVGGVTGVGKSHLLRKIVHQESLALFRFGWIDLEEVSPDDLTHILPDSPADIIIIDGYNSRHAANLAYLQRVCRFHAIVVAGVSSVGFSYDASLTVQPLEAGTAHNPGPATLLLEHGLTEPVNVLTRQFSVRLAKSAYGLPISLKLSASLANTLGLRSVVSQLEENTEEGPSAGKFLHTALSETLHQFGPDTRAAVIAMAGFGERLPVSLVTKLFNLDIFALKSIVDSGLLLSYPRSGEVRLAEAIAEQMRGGRFESEIRESQIRFETAVVNLCVSSGIHAASDELLVSHLRVFFRVAQSLVSRKQYELALQLVSVLRPHIAAFTDVNLVPEELEGALWNLEIDGSNFIRYSLSVGALYILRHDPVGLEHFFNLAVSDSRFAESPLELQIDFYSQMGLGHRLGMRLNDSEDIFDKALRMLDETCSPALELKLLHNKSITLAVAGKYAEALKTKRAALQLAEYAPNDHYRLELLHMEAVSMYEAGLPLEDIKSSFQVAIGFARMYRLSLQEGWMLQNAAHILGNSLTPVERAVMALVGIGLHISEGLSVEVRRHVKSSCVLLRELLAALNHKSIAVEAALFAQRLGPLPSVTSQKETVCEPDTNAVFFPYEIPASLVSPAEVSEFVSSCIRSLSSHPDAEMAVNVWGLDIGRWQEFRRTVTVTTELKAASRN